MTKAQRRALNAAISFISPRANTRLLFKQKLGREIDLENPRTLNEKLSKLKLERYGKDALVRRCADKYAVRGYVEDCGCGELLNPLLAVYDRARQLDWAALPERFVLKWNFGCGYNIICRDKAKLDEREVKRQLARWRREPFWAYYSELQYRHMPKKLLVEALIATPDGALPEDYKFYCFHGKAECVMVCCGRGEHTRFYFFDRQWQLMRINPDSKAAPEGFTLPKPEGLDAAFAYADRLSAPFAFVRTDLYIVQGRVYFGELTFTPAAAMDKRRLPETDLMFGDMLHLDRL